MVVIIAVLAALAVYGVRRYIYAAKSSEATHMLGSIKSAEEAYRSETYVYLTFPSNLTADGLKDPDSYCPRAPGTKKSSWVSPSAECRTPIGQLGVTASAPVVFGYAAFAVASGAAMPQPWTTTTYNWGPYATAPAPGYLVQAIGDLDGDGTHSRFVSSNWNDEIYIEDEGE